MPIGLKDIPAVGFAERETSDMLNQINQLSLSWGGLARVPGSQYFKNEMVRDGFYTMVATRDTTDRPAPQPIGQVEADQPDVPAFESPAPSDLSAVSSRHQYTLLKDGWIQAAQVWVPATGSNITYRFILGSLVPGATIPNIQTIDNPVLVAGQWNTLFVSNIAFVTGTIVSITIEAINSSGDTTWNHPWDFEGIQNNAGPPVGDWNRNNQHLIIRINDTDSDTTDQSVDLNLIIVGSLIRLASTAAPAVFFEYIITDVTDVGGYFEFGTILQQISAGGPTPGTPCTITPLIPTPQATQYETVLDWWIANQPTFATVIGSFEFAGLPVIGNGDNSFGIRVFFQEGEVSEDWDLVAFSGGNDNVGTSAQRLFLNQNIANNFFLGDFTIPVDFFITNTTFLITDERIHAGAIINLFPLNAEARAEDNRIMVSAVNFGSFEVEKDPPPAHDEMIFKYVIISR